jgi:hypothetical protein
MEKDTILREEGKLKHGKDYCLTLLLAGAGKNKVVKAGIWQERVDNDGWVMDGPADSRGLPPGHSLLPHLCSTQKIMKNHEKCNNPPVNPPYSKRQQRYRQSG